jgi:hypothetical protein
MVCVGSLLGTPVRFDVGRKNSHKVGQLPNSLRHRLTFRMLLSEQATCGADRGVGNAQVARIRDELDAAGFSAVKVGIADKFQGQEAPVAFISMTASSHGDVPRGMAFHLNRNRVNVAVSRAKWRAIIVRFAALTSYMPSSPAELLELGAFIGLCEASS